MSHKIRPFELCICGNILPNTTWEEFMETGFVVAVAQLATGIATLVVALLLAAQ